MSNYPAQVTAAELMHPGCTCVSTAQTVLGASKLMAEAAVGALPICGENDRLCGMLTDRDIVVKCLAAGLDPGTTTVGDLAEGRVFWVNEHASAREVMAAMEEHQIRRMPVIDDSKRLIGIIALRDVAKHLSRVEVGELVEAVVQEQPPHHFH